MSCPYTAFIACVLRTLSSTFITTSQTPNFFLYRYIDKESHYSILQSCPPQTAPWASLPFFFTLVTYFLCLSSEQIFLGKTVKKIFQAKELRADTVFFLLPSVGVSINGEQIPCYPKEMSH